MEKGKKIVDLVSGSFQGSFGPCNPVIVQKIQRQLQHCCVAFPQRVFPLKTRVSRRLLDYLSLGEGCLFYTVSGAEAIENAAKMARQITGRTLIAALAPSYHGATLGALSLTGDWRRDGHIFFEDDGVLRLPGPQEDPQGIQAQSLIEEVGPERIAAFCLETIPGVNGVLIPPQSWWDALSRLCETFSIKLILDEVLCGFHRTGAPFAFSHFGLTPDFVCLAKAITGGHIPFGAVWASESMASYYDDTLLSCGLTNYAHPLGLAALDGVLDLLGDDSFLARIKSLEEVFYRRMMDLVVVVRGVRVKGLLGAIDLEEAIPLAFFMERKIHLAVRERDKRLILAPSFNYSPQGLEEAMDRLQEAIDDATTT